MLGRENPFNGETSQGVQPGIVPVELRLRLRLETDAPLAFPSENQKRRPSFVGSRFPIARPFAGATIAVLLGWTIYYDLVDHHQGHVSTHVHALSVAPVSAVTFPANGTFIADFQSSEITGSGLTFETPPGDLGRLFVVGLEDWQTGVRVGQSFLRANSIETLRLPPGRYRVVVVSGHVWQGEKVLFGPETRVYETLRPIEVKADQTTPERLALFGEIKYPMTQVPTDVFVNLMSEHQESCDRCHKPCLRRGRKAASCCPRALGPG